MIRSFKDPETKVFWETGTSKRVPPPDLRRSALRKLLMLHTAGAIGDLRIPAGNRLEQLKGDRKGQYSIRINDRYRICFAWKGNDAYDVEITDYH